MNWIETKEILSLVTIGNQELNILCHRITTLQELEIVLDYLTASKDLVLSDMTDWIDFAKWYLTHPIHTLNKNVAITSILSQQEISYMYITGTTVSQIIERLDCREITMIYNRMLNRTTTNFIYSLL